MIRLLGLLGLIAVAALFALQNTDPAVKLVFLGIQTPALPLAVWVLGAIAAGSLTTLLISALFGLSSFVTRQTVRSQVRRTNSGDRGDAGSAGDRPSGTPSTIGQRWGDRFGLRSPQQPRSADEDAAWQDWRGYETAQPDDEAARSPANRSSANHAPEEFQDDWETPKQDDWESPPHSANPEATVPRTESPRSSSPRTGSSWTESSRTESSRTSPRTDFEARQSPRRSAQSGSVYSYHYRESDPERDSEPVQDRESDAPPRRPTPSIVDADYRVLVPPYSPPAEPAPSPPEETADDWFEDSPPDSRDRRS
jgi:uncharacterized integral membrane protein